MRSGAPLARWTLLLALLVVLRPAPGAAQEIAGMAVGPEGEPLAGVPVVLHRVGEGGGAFVATDTAGPDGTFHFAIESPDSAIYFAVVRYEGRMYVGPAAQAGAEPVTGYVLRVEPAAEAGAVGAALSGRAPAMPPARPASRTGDAASNDIGAIVLVALLGLSTATAFLVAAPRYRRRRTREALVEIAGIDRRLDDPEFDGDRADLRQRRDALREQLAPRP
ncbi:MAG: hypothetical protein GWM90_02960 [Gemmatimonadetes bacterium]|nr:hypothetical protein [Gemmatimonadota bacterium]NIQ52575.1 hypothetical protein [Gemmatimonadota bacterium]NIU72713.1 hypothetical protein [Gammaproteobacteria bacterium]NIX43119.1 hypothetical protein [Gemmatimonadota bacterium]NIY07281.1 hypothetical protein [Gemmatimonadota bacterium]